MKRRQTVMGAALVVAALTAGVVIGSGGAASGRPAAQRTVRSDDVATRPADYGTEFHSITPCKIASLTVKKGEVRNLEVRGSVDMSYQGGPGAGCGIPAAATSIAATVYTSAGTGTGFLSGWAYRASGAHSTFGTFWKDRPDISNPTLPLTPDTTADEDLSIQATHAATKVRITVDGYSEPPIEGLVYVGGSTAPAAVVSGSPRVLSAQRLEAGQVLVRLDTDVSHCAVLTNALQNYTLDSGAPASQGRDDVLLYAQDTDDGSGADFHYIEFAVLC